MDVLKRTQRACKGGLLRVIREVVTVLDASPVDLPFVKNLMIQLKDMETKLKQADENILAQMYVTEGITDAEIETEMAGTRDPYIRVARVQTRVDLVAEVQPQPNPVQGNADGGIPQRVDNLDGNRMTTHLPKIKIATYNGEIGEWLGFWAQFQNIHDDEKIPESNKFQYLKQAMVPGTKASRIVNGFPPTTANYSLAINELKRRCGDKVLISEYYVRQLIKVLIRVNTKGKEGSLSLICDELESHLRSLESLGISMEHCGVILYPLVESSLPLDTIVVWQRTPGSGYGDEGDGKTSNDRLKALMKFLKQEVRGEERLDFVKEDYGNEASTRGIIKSRSSPKVRFQDEYRNKAPPTVAGLFSGEDAKCIFCNKGNHDSQNCYSAKKMPMEERKAIIQRKRCCFTCLRPNHTAQNCKSFVRCMVCDQKHPTIMHNFSNANQGNANLTKPPSFKDKSTGAVTNLNANFAGSSSVYLGTFKTTVVNGNTNLHVRGLYDPGAHRSYVSKATARFLKLKPTGNELIKHTLFGGVQTQAHQFNKYSLTVLKGKEQRTIDVLEKDRICGNLSKLPKRKWMEELEFLGISVSDLDRDTPDEIELMIGADVHGQFLTGRIHQLSNGLTAQEETILGWIVTGRKTEDFQNDDQVAMTVTTLHVAESSMENLWSLETIGIKDVAETTSKDERDRATKEHFMKTVSRKEDGRYSVRLPWIEANPIVPENRAIAERRLERMTEDLLKKEKFAEYEEIFQQCELEDFIEEVPQSMVNRPSCYLPHRAVFKPSSLTTPIRPVFDASCKAKRSPSLNGCLEKGPNLLEQMPALLMRFREKTVGVTADIRKAFQMVEVHEEDRNFLRFLWWEDYGKRKLKVYRHKRVVFGVNCSPFLLAAVIEAHLKSVDEDRRMVADKLLKSFYVDNCVTSVDTVQEFQEFQHQATQLMSEVKMDLRVWQCGFREEPRVGSSTNRECGLGTGGAAAPTGESKQTTVLGMLWDTKNDTLTCDNSHSELPEKFTKRSVLSFIQQIFDPLGIMCPVMLSPKKLMQEAWSTKTGWDDELTEVQQSTFQKWMQEAHQLEEVIIPRHFSEEMSSSKSYQLHCFCDASLDAYAAVVYLRTEDNRGVTLQLLMAKSRISPLKKITIPRLELMSCTIGARLSDLVRKALTIKNVPMYFWTDSTTALAWIKNNDEWGTFVGNRVKEILTLSDAQDWRHVPGLKNPADLPSRGCTPAQLVRSRWWEGPEWLTTEDWPIQRFEVNKDEVLKERKKTVLAAVSTDQESPWFAKHSSYSKNVRNLAWIIRFTKWIRKKDVETGPLTVAEFEKAEKIIMKLVQSEAFSKGGQVITGIKTVTVDNLIRVNSKLMYRKDTLGFKQPILLPSSHPVVDQLIEETHRIHGHAGVQFVMGALREKFWILRGRKIVRRIISACVICRRFTANHPTTEVAPLPEDRVKVSKPFETVGVDLAGPLYLKGREKVWVVLLTCAVFRCVHLELVRSLSTEAFLDVFSRFMDRRGRPVTVYSDNGTNFVGAANLFREIDWDKVTRKSTIQRIQWRFNPPSVAWWGGWWERLVRSMKDLLKRILGQARVTFDKLSTYLTSVEATHNGRPLTTVTEDPEDLRPLTPAMFLHDLPTTSYSELDFISAPELQQQIIQRKTILDEFRSRFRKEYLGHLFQKANETIRTKLTVGDVVLVGADNKKRWEWPMAKVMDLYPGKDGVVRVVRVKTERGVLIRPIKRLFPLEVSSGVEIAEIKEGSSSTSQGPEEDSRPLLSRKKDQDEKKEEIITRSGRKVKTPAKFNE